MAKGVVGEWALAADGRRAGRMRIAIAAGVVATILGVAVYGIVTEADSPAEVTEAYLSAFVRGDLVSAYGCLAATSKAGLDGPNSLSSTAIGAIFAHDLADSYEIGATSSTSGQATVEVALVGGGGRIPLKIHLVEEGRRWVVEI